MSMTNPVPSHTMPRFHEASSQRSMRDGDAVSRQWQKNQTTTRQTRALHQNVHQIQRQLDRMRRYKGGASSGTIYFPFKILPSPSMTDEQRLAVLTALGELTTPDDGRDVAGRTFRVRAGRIGDGTTQAVFRTDGANSDPDDINLSGTESYDPMDDMTGAGVDFTVDIDDAGTAMTTYVYANRTYFSAGVWYVMVTANPTGIVWGDGDNILLATITTENYLTTGTVTIRQYVRTDLSEPAIVCNPYA